jgi:hypothetical protein
MSIVLNIIAEANLKGLKSAIKEFESLKTAGQKANFAISKAALPAAAAVAGLAAAGYAAAKAAAEEELAMKKLATQIANSTRATSGQITANEEYISKLQYTAAVSDDELRPALSALVTGTNSLSYAQKLLGVALNVSAATGQDLGSVSEALSKGYAGNMRALSALSPEIKAAVASGADFADVLVILEDNFAGASDAAANTAAGGLKKMQIAMDDAQETLGTALLPYLTAFADNLAKAAKWVKENTGLAIAFGLALGGIGVALVAAKAAMVVYNAIAAITTASNTALATSGFAVQISTGVGIASAIAGAAALAGIAVTIAKATKVNNDYAASVDGVGDSWAFMENLISGPLEVLDRLIAENAAKAEAAAAKAKAAAEKARNAAKRLFEETKKAIEQGKEALREYAAGLADTVRGWISLSNAVSAGTESETAYQDALKERMAAYEELNKLQKSGLYTTEQMADATERVTRAEAGLNTAQSNRKSYSQQFADQIAAAKKFGGQLQQLIAAGLGKSGLAQLMNLGPVAGSQVAADLLAGTGGMTVASLNTDLASIDTAGVALGADAIAGDMSLLNQASATRSGNTISITVTSADPNAVVAALQKYVRTSGPVPIRIRNP